MIDDKYRSANEGLNPSEELNDKTVGKMTNPAPNRNPRRAMRWALVGLAVVLCAGVAVTALRGGISTGPVTSGNGTLTGALATVAPAEEKTLQADFENRQTAAPDESLLAALRLFGDKSSKQVFSVEDAENKLYSPLSAYYALAATAQAAKGETRDQLLKALEAYGISDLAQKNQELTKSLLFRNEVGLLNLGTSFWMKEGYPFQMDFVKQFALDNSASLYSGDFTDKAFSELYTKWVSEQTNGQLTEAALPEDPDAVMVLVSALSYQDHWAAEFQKDKTADKAFTKADGTAVTVPFMYAKKDMNLYKGSNYTAVGLPFVNGGSMVFLLPDEGVEPEALLGTGALEEAARNLRQGGGEYGKVTLEVPKFEYSTKMDLIGTLKALGVEDAFIAGKADFSQLVSGGPALFISQVIQEATVSVDEEGCRAAAYTQVGIERMSAPLDLKEYEMLLDRPFLYSIVTDQEVPLFVGTLGDPSAE